MVRTVHRPSWFIACIATLLAFTVVILGAYTRLKDAGLGCPDWPTCYGKLLVPKTPSALLQAQLLYPRQPVEAAKAWAEMTHRYFAGTLGLLILALAVIHFAYRPLQKFSTVPLILLGLVIFQALLGMWTVTWQLHPLIVMGHLLGGMSIAALLWWQSLSAGKFIKPLPGTNHLRPWVVLGLIVVFVQIFLGGWTSANYASIICPDFPFCQGSLFPTFDFYHAFNFFSPIGQNYQGGVLGTTARVTIQMMHRYWAIMTVSYIGLLAGILFFKKSLGLVKTGGVILCILYAQFSLGILNIQTKLSLPIAVIHNGAALLLLLALVTLLYQTKDSRHATH